MMSFEGFRTIAGFTEATKSAATDNSNRLKTLAMVLFISSIANLFPMQFLGPALNGR